MRPHMQASMRLAFPRRVGASLGHGDLGDPVLLPVEATDFDIERVLYSFRQTMIKAQSAPRLRAKSIQEHYLNKARSAKTRVQSKSAIV